MNSLSCSFTLGKAGSVNGANVEHNNREFVADNVDPNRISDNITYVKIDVREAYNELFGAALEEYNAKQTRSDRKIDDYYSHIAEGRREEAFYEIIVQFGDSKVAPIGSENGELCKKLLDEYVRSFKERNPNMKIFNLVTHLDEVSPHCHINIIPFYTPNSKLRKNGLSKGVSMRAALEEQGFTNKHKKENSLVAWEDSELKYMEKILKRHGLSREVKNAIYAHMSVENYKESQDEKKIAAVQNWNSEKAVEQLRQENDMLRVEKQKLTSEKFSPWKSFFYSVPEKQSFVMEQLVKLQIPFRETENGFEAQEIHVEQIRNLEKQFKPQSVYHRDTLRDSLDKIIMQSKNYSEVLERLKQSGCSVKQGKYISVKPKSGNQFIRLKSLGEDYSEQAIQRRLLLKANFENVNNNKITSSKNPDSLETMTYKTIQHYTVVFAAGVLPVRKRNKKRAFGWENCEELNKLAELNKKINAGLTLTNLRNKFAGLEKSVAEKEAKLIALKSELDLIRDLYKRGERCFKFYSEDEKDLAFLAEHKVNAENYGRILKLITANEAEIAELEKNLPEERGRLKEAADTLTVMEKVAGGVYVQSLIDDEQNRTQSVYVKNGLKRAD